jgi:glucose/arabinose dehydrogenase
MTRGESKSDGVGSPRHDRPAAGVWKVCGSLLLCALSIALLSFCGCGSSGAPGPRTRSSAGALVPIGAGLEGPAGLRVSVYAKGPPTLAAFAFDAKGRLWLTAAGLEAHAHDGVYMIAKAGAPPVKVISHLDDPLGIVWYDGQLYVASVGRVDVFSGLRGTRFTKRRRIVEGPVAKGENNLLVMAPDGRFLMGVTATCDHCTPRSKFSGSVVSFRPDGSDLRLYARRIRAPFGLAYFPGTSDLFVSMNQQDNLGADTPGDWLAIVREGQNWRFPACHGQGGSACVGAPKPVAVLDKHAAVGGIAFATGQLGPTIRTSALVAEWNVSKVQQVALTKAGSSYQGTVTPFLTGVRNPLALAFAPDGSLLVGDWATGMIYRIQSR